MKTVTITLFLTIALSLSASAKVSVDRILKSSFSKATKIEKKRIILSSKQFAKVKSKAKTAVRTKVYRYYDIKRKSKSLGKAILITRKVRSKKATVLYAFDNKSRLKLTEIMAFSEPPEFIPSKRWMSQLQNKNSSAKLKIGKDIPTISGATLSAYTITDGARVARAIFQLLQKRR
ncbi:MAG: hypothetical protein QM493_07785 [Sulfurovum sp.]